MINTEAHGNAFLGLIKFILIKMYDVFNIVNKEVRS
jgi:hypothetical protein